MSDRRASHPPSGVPTQPDQRRSTVAYCQGRVAPNSIHGCCTGSATACSSDEMLADVASGRSTGVSRPGSRGAPAAWRPWRLQAAARGTPSRSPISAQEQPGARASATARGRRSWTLAVQAGEQARRGGGAVTPSRRWPRPTFKLAGHQLAKQLDLPAGRQHQAEQHAHGGPDQCGRTTSGRKYERVIMVKLLHPRTGVASSGGGTGTRPVGVAGWVCWWRTTLICQSGQYSPTGSSC
jgi:hypothetical protein